MFEVDSPWEVLVFKLCNAVTSCCSLPVTLGKASYSGSGCYSLPVAKLLASSLVQGEQKQKKERVYSQCREHQNVIDTSYSCALVACWVKGLRVRV